MSEHKLASSQPYANLGWRRWKMNTVEQAPAPATEHVSNEPIALPDDVVVQLEELGRSIRVKAQLAGHDAGYAAGHAEGYAAGKAEGLEAGTKEGYDQGFQAGHEEGRGLSKNEAEQLSALASACAQSLSTVESDVGQALINLAINIAQQVVRSTLQVHPEKILDTVRDILYMENGKDSALQLRVHPDDLQLIREHLADDPSSTKWRLIADETILRGGCTAETILGNIDATLQTRWQRVTSALGLPLAWENTP